MKYTAWVTIASLLMYIWIFAKVGKARGTFKIPAPITDGPTEFQSIMRVQTNTVEQLVLFLPLLWLCSYYSGDLWGAGFGAVWVIGRIMYALGYYQAPEKRSPGFMVSSIAGIALLIGAIIGLIFH